ncbi:ferredoxin reductase [Mesorhizobium ephedrae]|uniref:Ferredoxin reductase n=2 Tax=Kumtagia ephedrae TaxID=2116701 RepID=A0A2P7RZG5_9HYPH|nr:ferredoxin reductase [Mesorhizobium ephedrae]
MAVDGGMVIVGAGECGARAAFALREAGYGGRVTLIGEERHPPYERPPLSKDAITGPQAPGAKTIAEPGRYADAAIALMLSSPVVSIDRAARRISLADGGTLPYDRLLLATGCSPRRLALAREGPRIAYLRTLDDAGRIAERLGPGKRLAVIGGGFIGLELAASARQRRTDVTVVEAQPRILMRGVPADIAERIHRLHADNGVRILCGVGIAAIEDAGDRVAVRLADGRTVEAELLLVGIGAVPNVALAEAAGLALDNGIAVDATLATSDPFIFAAGDCCSFPLASHDGRRTRLESWRNAQEQGALAARNMLGAGEAHAAVPWFWSDQYDHTMQIAGVPDHAATTVRRDLADGAFILFQLAEDGRLMAAGGVGPGNVVAKDVRLAEMLIARGAKPDPASLADPGFRLKSLLG